MQTRFASALVAAVAALTLTSFAATPVAVWDGDFSTMTKGGCTLSENGNTKESGYLQISGDNGILLTSTDALNVFTVIARCEGLNLSAEKGQVLFTSYGAENAPNDNKTGVYLPANNALCRGIWEGADWNTGATQGSVPANYTTLIYNHQQSNGTYAYALGPTSDVDDTVVRTTLYSVVGLRSSGTTYKGFAIGGLRGTTSEAFLSATGLKITSLAVFSGTLTEAEMKAYAFPSETQEISIDNDTTVSAINHQAGAAKGVVLTVVDGVAITYDVNFTASSVKLISDGSISLSAKAPPSKAELAKLDCNGVSGALVRTWLNPGVVGYNFRNDSGGDTAGQLATGGTWFISANSANGTDTGLFADGLTKLAWSASGTYASGVGSSITTGYLDDNSSQSPVIKLSAVPYATYDVVIYCSTDSDNFQFSAKEVNGTLYTWDGSQTVTTEDENAAWGQSRSATIVEGTNALRVNGLSGALTIKGGKYSNATLRCRSCIAAIQIMPAGVSSGKSEIVIDAREGWTTTDSDMLGSIRTSYRNVRVLGSGQNGATLNFGYLNDDSMYISSHIVFDGGTHAVTINGAYNSTIGSNASEPILEVLDGTTLDFYQHDLSGWLGSAAAKVPTCKIQVDDGGQLNIRLNGAGTTYYQGRYTICPGAVITSYVTTSDDGNSHLRFNGGAVKGAEQIYVPATQAVEPGVATFNGADGNTGIFLASDVTAGLGVFVGDNSTLEFNLDIAGVAGAPLSKWGDGTLNLNGDLSGYQGTLAIHEGTVFVSTETTLGSVTVDEGATLAYSYDAQPSISFGSLEGTIVVDVSSLVSGGVIESGTYQIAPAGIPAYRVVVTGLPENSGFSVSATANDGIVLSDQVIEWTGASGTWSANQFNGKTGSTDGLDVSFSQGTTPLGEVTVAVDGEKSVNSASFVAKDTEYTLTGDKITADNGVVVGSAAPVRIYNAIDGAVTINAGSELTLAGDGAALQNGQLSGSGTLVLDPGEGKTYTMSPANTLFTGEAVIASGTVKMGDGTSFGPIPGAGTIRVLSNAKLDVNGALAIGAYGKDKNRVVLAKDAALTASRDYYLADRKSAFTSLTVTGDAIVDTTTASIRFAQTYDYGNTTVNVDTNTLLKIGDNDLYLSRVIISGTGTIDIREGSMTVTGNYYGNKDNTFNDGTLIIESAARLILSQATTTDGPKVCDFTVTNLVLNGGVERAMDADNLIVTGYITGNGTTPMLTLGANAVFKPTGTGYLTITESLTLPTEIVSEEEVPYMVIDLTDALASGAGSIPLFKVGSAENLPEAGDIYFVYPGQAERTQVLPRGWSLSKTSDGGGYRLSKGGFSIRLR